MMGEPEAQGRHRFVCHVRFVPSEARGESTGQPGNIVVHAMINVPSSLSGGLECLLWLGTAGTTCLQLCPFLLSHTVDNVDEQC